MSVAPGADLINITATWADAQKYSPAPRHRRRLIMNWLQSLEFGDCLDAGCAQGYLLEGILRNKRASVYGCDISDKVIRFNRQRLPSAEFRVLDLSKQA